MAHTGDTNEEEYRMIDLPGPVIVIWMAASAAANLISAYSSTDKRLWRRRP